METCFPSHLIKRAILPAVITTVAASFLLIGILALNQIGALARIHDYAMIPTIAGTFLFLLDISLIILIVKNSLTHSRKQPFLVVEESDTDERVSNNEEKEKQPISPNLAAVEGFYFFENLPQELLVYILNFLPSDDLVSASTVNKEWYLACNTKPLFQRGLLYLATFSILSVLEHLSRNEGSQKILEVITRICELEWRLAENIQTRKIFDNISRNSFYFIINYFSEQGHFELIHQLANLYPEKSKAIYFKGASNGDLASAEKLFDLLPEAYHGTQSLHQPLHQLFDICCAFESIVVAAYRRNKELAENINHWYSSNKLSIRTCLSFSNDREFTTWAKRYGLKPRKRLFSSPDKYERNFLYAYTLAIGDKPTESNSDDQLLSVGIEGRFTDFSISDNSHRISKAEAQIRRAGFLLEREKSKEKTPVICKNEMMQIENPVERAEQLVEFARMVHEGYVDFTTNNSSREDSPTLTF